MRGEVRMTSADIFNKVGSTLKLIRMKLLTFQQNTKFCTVQIDFQ